MASVKLETFLLETRTNDLGEFSIAHGLEKFNPDVYHIKGIVVAIQHKNNNWHTMELSHVVDNRFWWNDVAVCGLVASPNFHRRPVRIIVFAQFVVG